MDFVHPVTAVIPGAQGRVLTVLTETTAELSLRTLARLAGVSVAQASRVLPSLVELGLVERREVPPSSQFRLCRNHVAARSLLALSTVEDTVLAEIGRITEALPVRPISVIVFGSFARGEARRDSDLDILIIRPSGLSEDDEQWADSVEQWRGTVRALTGNPVDVLDIDADEAAKLLQSDRQVWRDIRHDGRVVYGLSINDLEDGRRG